MTSRDIAQMIDHAILRPELMADDVLNGCDLARKYRIASVCVRPCDVALAESALRGSQVAVGTVIGFPHGASHTQVKVLEAKRAMDDGAVELDMVLNIGRLKSGDANDVREDIEAVVRAAHQRGALVKVILENCYLSDAQKEMACRISADAGADFVKTSTGFGPGGHTLEDIRLMAAAVAGRCRIKASGGVRTLAAALAAHEAGCARIGTTSTQAIMEEAVQKFG